MLLDESERPKSLRKDGQRRIISDRRKERAAEKPEGSETDVGSQHPASGPGLSLGALLWNFKLKLKRKKATKKAKDKRDKNKKQAALHTPHKPHNTAAAPRATTTRRALSVRRLISYGEYRCCVFFFCFFALCVCVRGD